MSWVRVVLSWREIERNMITSVKCVYELYVCAGACVCVYMCVPYVCHVCAMCVCA